MQMEDSWEDLVSHREMGDHDDDDVFNQSQMSSFNEEEFLRDIIVEKKVLSPESDSPSNDHPSSSSAQSNYCVAFAKSCSSFSNLKPSPKGYILSFDNPVVVEPVFSQHHPTLMSFKNRTQSHCIEPERVQQRTKKARNSSEIEFHIQAERKRRQELTKSIIALSATIPGLKKTDKANVLREAVKYVKELQERVKELENKKRKECVDSIILMKKTQLCINDQATLSGEMNSDSCNGIEQLPEVEATILEKEVLIGIHCEKQRHSLCKILSLLNNLHLSSTSSSVLPFGSSTVKITIITKMDEEYNMPMDDLVKTLRQRLSSMKP